MSYVCTKKLSLGGNDYYPGDTIPDIAILPGRVDKLKAYGYIAEQDAPPLAETEADTQDVTEPVFVIPIAAEGGVTEGSGIIVTEGSVSAAAVILQMTVEQAGEAIKSVEDRTALKLVQALDSRKGVKTAAAAKLEELQGGEAG